MAPQNVSLVISQRLSISFMHPPSAFSHTTSVHRQGKGGSTHRCGCCGLPSAGAELISGVVSFSLLCFRLNNDIVPSHSCSSVLRARSRNLSVVAAKTDREAAVDRRQVVSKQSLPICQSTPLNERKIQKYTARAYVRANTETRRFCSFVQDRSTHLVATTWATVGRWQQQRLCVRIYKRARYGRTPFVC